LLVGRLDEQGGQDERVNAVWVWCLYWNLQGCWGKGLCYSYCFL